MKVSEHRCDVVWWSMYQFDGGVDIKVGVEKLSNFRASSECHRYSYILMRFCFCTHNELMNL